MLLTVGEKQVGRRLGIECWTKTQYDNLSLLSEICLNH